MTKPIGQIIIKNWLWLGVNAVALLLLARLVWMVADAPFSRGPIMFTTDMQQNIILFSGKTALILLVASLACTPAARILSFPAALKVRKSLGLWGFAYACFHALYFMGGKNLLLEGEAWLNVWQMLPSIFSGFTKTPYARYGAYALTLLLLLAATSNRLAMRNLGKNWKRLHRLVYLATPLAVYHYWQREEYQHSGEPPDYWQPVIFAVVVGLLLMVRVPLVRRQLAGRLNIRGLQKKLQGAKPAIAPPVLKPMTVRPSDKGSGSAHRANANGHATGEEMSKLRSLPNQANGMSNPPAIAGASGLNSPEPSGQPFVVEKEVV
jgi:sulfoxide reductase heme-binding subunit YedZ